MEFAIKGETKDGGILMLRRGFPTRDAAEDHPIQMSLWKRVWVEEIEPVPVPIETPPPFPWTVQWIGVFAYVLDADGRRIASLLGSQKRREHVAEIICGLGG